MRLFNPYSGMGALSLGFQRAGFTVAGADNSVHAVAYYRDNVGPCYHGDVNQTHPPWDADVVAAHPMYEVPCWAPGVTVRTAVKFEKGGHFWNTFRIALEARAKILLLFWYPGPDCHPVESVHYRILQAMRAAGYAGKGRFFDGADFGIPQHWRRVVLVGFREKEVARHWEWPIPTHADPKVARKRGRKSWVTVAETIPGIPYPHPAPPVTVKEASNCGRPLGEGQRRDHYQVQGSFRLMRISVGEGAWEFPTYRPSIDSLYRLFGYPNRPPIRAGSGVYGRLLARSTPVPLAEALGVAARETLRRSGWDFARTAVA